MFMAQQITYRETSTEQKMRETFSDGLVEQLKEILGIETFNTRVTDEEDFYQIAVWQLVEALEFARRSGYARGRKDVIEQVGSTGVG